MYKVLFVTIHGSGYTSASVHTIVEDFETSAQALEAVELTKAISINHGPFIYSIPLFKETACKP